MSLAQLMAEGQRADTLRVLAEAPGFRLNNDALKRVLANVGHDLGGDQVRQILLWLEQHGLLRIDKLPREGGEMWIAILTEAGGDVASGRPHVGVAPARPKG